VLSARIRAGTVADLATLPAGKEVTLAVRAPEVPEGELFAPEEAWRFAALDDKGAALAGEAARPEELVQALGDRPVVVHDAKALGLVPQNLAHDTLVGAYLLDPAARAYPLEELCTDRALSAEVDDEVVCDAVLTSALAGWQREQLRERGHERLMQEVELPLVRVLRHMEQAGLKLDIKRLAEISTRVKQDAAQLEREIFELAGEEFTIGSPQQLSHILFEKLGLSRKRRGKTGFSTDARVLQAIRDEHPIIPKIERFRELTKLAQTYLDAFPELIADDGRLHTTFSQVSASTGRLASTNPNLQNIPIRTELGREIRSCFVAEEGDVLLSADYSQVELRVLAKVADEPVLKEIFRRGEDVHTATAKRVFGVAADDIDPGMRSKSKMINYGIVYGLSGWGMADRLGIPQEEAEQFIEAYLAGFPKVKEFIDRTIERATEDGYVTTLFGRRRRVPELRARRWETRRLGERLAVNTVIQGTAADIIKVAMVRSHDALREAGLRTRLILQIHDELLFEGPPDEMGRAKEIVCAEMAGAYELDPPLAVDVGVGPNWTEAK
jgi:DNA polymerase-1